MKKQLAKLMPFLAAAALVACLAPLSAVYFVEMAPREAAGEYHLDPATEALVYSKEGLQIKVRFLSDEALRAEIPGPQNPYVLQEFDARRGYRPTAFTVFQVAVVNPTLAKVRLDPGKVELLIDQGKSLGSFAIDRADALGNRRNFETYFLSRGVQNGNQQRLYLEQMGKVRETIYHRDAPVFKGKTYAGKIVFEALPPETVGVELVLHDFILAFGIHDESTERVTLRFPFAVSQGVREQVAERR
ncbi:MAG: hypothetical protein FJY95_01005 [Candidatus Handelsmanbacteria bacterium]|nr:hypothetical protein [Candidatus Handelsmanbacteria bacterium]